MTLQEIAEKVVRLHEYSDRTGVIVTRSIAGLLSPLTPEQTSEVIDLVTAALPPRPKSDMSALGGAR